MSGSQSLHALPFRRSRIAIALTFLGLGLVACDDDSTGPAARGQLSVDAAQVQFADADPVLGSVEMPVVTIRNSGTGSLTVTDISIGGTDANQFDFSADAVPFNLASGAEREVSLVFAPTMVGTYSADLQVQADGSDDASVALEGRSVRFTYAQVDRKGIPGLNTVFNHPSGVGPFDKTAYNVASPAMDIANYRAQFVVVLDAVANPDSEATADLLLPDELPVNMGAPTAFGSLTGRALVDDATDVALMVTVGVPSLRSDNVGANDKAFLATFPYLAEPH